MKHFGGKLAGLTIGVWGLAFKPSTDDIREAPSLVLIEGLLAGGEGAGLRPGGDGECPARLRRATGYCDRPYDALEGADALAIVTEWKHFINPDFELMRAMRAAGDLRRPQSVPPGADEASRFHVLQHRKAGGIINSSFTLGRANQ